MQPSRLRSRRYDTPTACPERTWLHSQLWTCLAQLASRLTASPGTQAADAAAAVQTPQTPAQLLAANSNVQSPLIGYAIVGGYYPASALTAGLTLTTTDYVQASASMREPLTLTVQAGGVVRALLRFSCSLCVRMQACSAPQLLFH